MKLPENDEDWADVARISICIRRAVVLQDGLKKARKARFDPAKLLKVYSYTYQSRVLL